MRSRLNRIKNWNRRAAAKYSDGYPDWRRDFVYDGRGRLRQKTLSEWNYYYQEWSTVSVTRYVYDGMRVIYPMRYFVIEDTPESDAGFVGCAPLHFEQLSHGVKERDDSNVPTVSYTRGTDLSGSLEGAGGIGGLLARSHGYSSGSWSTHNYYHSDGNGSPREIMAGMRQRPLPAIKVGPQPQPGTATLSHGEIVTYLETSGQGLAAKYRYDPYGNTISSSGSLASANVYRFSSKEVHANSGLYYYGYRFYAPQLQRWPNRDPLGEDGGINLYRPANNAPVNQVDDFGRQGYTPPPPKYPPIEVPGGGATLPGGSMGPPSNTGKGNNAVIKCPTDDHCEPGKTKNEKKFTEKCPDGSTVKCKSWDECWEEKQGTPTAGSTSAIRAPTHWSSMKKCDACPGTSPNVERVPRP